LGWQQKAAAWLEAAIDLAGNSLTGSKKQQLD
jgi:hypothetical protein